jgi:hypothetical protein
MWKQERSALRHAGDDIVDGQFGARSEFFSRRTKQRQCLGSRLKALPYLSMDKSIPSSGLFFPWLRKTN